MIRRLRTRAGEESGFAMVAVLAVLLVASLIAVAAVNASDGDLGTSQRDKNRKMAYAAAEAGLNDYLARLVTNVDYWHKCGQDPFNASLNDVWTGTGKRNWDNVPGTNEMYSVEVLPANGATTCSTADPQGTMIDTQTGTFRIRSTGKVGQNGDRRSIVATFKRRGFLDYVYFTDYEDMDPEWSVLDSNGQDSRQNLGNNNWGQKIVPWATDNCVKYYRAGTRQNARYTSGQWKSGTVWKDINPVAGCREINFVSGDKVAGPFHTNDEILVCGNPAFGRSPADDIEISGGGANANQGSSTGWRNCGNGAPQVNDPNSPTQDPNLGTWRTGSPLLEMPPSNTKLHDVATPSYRFIGLTKIQLAGASIKAVNDLTRENGTTIKAGSTFPAPPNGVLYVGNDPNPTNDPTKACSGYDPARANDISSGGCGDLWVDGSYKVNLTLSAQNDIVIDEDIKRDPTQDVLLGLIADQWLRIYHPANANSTFDSCTNSGGPGDISIDAALLAVNDSFTVDRYWCGAQLGKIHLTGAIAQRFRGTVGTSANTGYIKDYKYDDRLKFRTPPQFLDPVQASWKIQSQVEQVPAT